MQMQLWALISLIQSDYHVISVFFKETMEDWDQETLEKVVESKKTEYKQNKPTDIVSFLYDLFVCCVN